MKKEEEIEKQAESTLKLIDAVVHLTSTKEEENIFHQGFYSGYRKCEEETFTRKDIEEVLSGFTDDVYFGYVKTNFIERLEKLK